MPWLRSSSLLVALSALASVGCSQALEAELLEVRELAPERVQPGHRLMLSGSGFPAGREARVRFAGTLHRPALEPRAIDLELVGTAISADRVELAMPAAAIRRFGGRGTFRGTITVAFGAAAPGGEGYVVGSLRDAVVDLVPSDPIAPPGDPTLAPRLGLELAPAEDGDPGVLVARVAQASRAAAAGLVPGDRLLALGGLRLLSVGELAPRPDDDRVELTVEREGELAAFPVAISLDGIDEEVPFAAIVQVQLAALALFAALLLFGPGASWLDRLAPTSQRVPWRLALAAIACALLARRALASAPSVGLDAVLLALAATRAAVLFLGARGASERAAALTRGLAGGIAIAGALAAAVLGAGTTSPAMLEAAQGPWPTDWLALRTPAGPFAALAMAIAAACGPRSASAPRALRAIDDALLVLLATSATILLAGGASIATAIADVRPALGWIGSLAFAASTALATILLARARDRGAEAPATLLALGALAAATLASAAAVGWLELEVPRAIERAVAQVLLAISALAITRVATARPPGAPRPAHALL